MSDQMVIQSYPSSKKFTGQVNVESSVNSFVLICATHASKIVEKIALFAIVNPLEVTISADEIKGSSVVSCGQDYAAAVVMSSERPFTYDLAQMELALQSPVVPLPENINDIDSFEAWLEQF